MSHVGRLNTDTHHQSVSEDSRDPSVFELQNTERRDLQVGLPTDGFLCTHLQLYYEFKLQFSFILRSNILPWSYYRLTVHKLKVHSVLLNRGLKWLADLCFEVGACKKTKSCWMNWSPLKLFITPKDVILTAPPQSGALSLMFCIYLHICTVCNFATTQRMN